MHEIFYFTVENRCQSHKCEHLCVLTAESSACLCKNGFPIRITGTCNSDFSVVHLASQRHGDSSSWYIFLIMLAIIVLLAIVGLAGFKYYPRRKWPFISLPSFMNRISTNRFVLKIMNDDN